MDRGNPLVQFAGTHRRSINIEIDDLIISESVPYIDDVLVMTQREMTVGNRSMSVFDATVAVSLGKMDVCGRPLARKQSRDHKSKK